MSFSFGAVKSNQNAQPTGTNLSFGVATPSSAFSGGFGGGGVSFGGQSNFFTNTTSASPSSTSSTSVAPIVSSNNQPSFSNPATAQINVNTGLFSGSSSIATGSAQGSTDSFDCLYKDLTSATKEIVDRTFSEFKAPTRSHLLELERYLGQTWADRMVSMARVKVRTLGVETRQQQLQQMLRPNLEQTKQLAREARACRSIGGLQQIRASSSSSSEAASKSYDEALPAVFYKHVEQALERRLQQVSEALCHLQRLELSRRNRHWQRPDLNISGVRGVEESEAQDALYGQPKRIGAKQLLELLQRQNEAFMRVAAMAAEVHNEAAAAKSRFLRDREPTQDPDPFVVADRKEQAERRLQQQKMRSESNKFQLSQSAQLSSSVSSVPLSSSQAPVLTQPGGSGIGFGPVGAGNITSSSPQMGFGLGSQTGGFGSVGATGVGFGPNSMLGTSFGASSAIGAGFGASGGGGMFGSGATTGAGVGSGIGQQPNFGNSLDPAQQKPTTSVGRKNKKN